MQPTATLALALAATLASTTLLAQPTTAPTTAPAAAPTTAPAVQEEPEEVRISVGRDGEYDALIAELGLEGEQLERFDARVRERLTKLQAFADSPEGLKLVELRTQLAAARREKRTDDVTRLRAEVQPFADAYWRVRLDTRLAILSELTADQQVRTAGFALQQRMLRRVRDPGSLPPERRDAIRQIADDVAREWLTPEKLQSDPFFRTIEDVLPTALERLKAVMGPTTREAR